MTISSSKLRMYIDSNVFHSVVDDQVAKFSRYFFSLLFSNHFISVSSSLVASEINFVENLPIRYWKKAFPLSELAKLDGVAFKMAKSYIDSGIIPQSEYFSALNIAVASIHKCDYFVSWDYKYIVNISNQKKIQAINQMMGLSQLKICTPAMVII